VDLPAGSYVGGIVTLTGGLRLAGRWIGFPAPPRDTLTLPAGRTWKASYLVLKNGDFHWRRMRKGYETGDVAERALAEMGFAGKPPYRLELKQGTLDRLAYEALLTAEKGGIAGRCVNPAGKALLMHVPLRIRKLNRRCASALWRSVTKRLDWFACFGNEGYVTFDADRTVDFYAGAVARCAPALFVSAVLWNDKEAWFRVNNPTNREITTTFATVEAIRGYKPIRKRITVPAGRSLDVRE